MMMFLGYQFQEVVDDPDAKIFARAAREMQPVRPRLRGCNLERLDLEYRRCEGRIHLLKIVTYLTGECRLFPRSRRVAHLSQTTIALGESAD